MSKTETGKSILLMEPQPKPCGNDTWLYGGEVFLSDDTLRDHLFHNIYGKEGSPYGAVYGDGSSDRFFIGEIALQIEDVRIDRLRDIVPENCAVNLWVWAIEWKELPA